MTHKLSYMTKQEILSSLKFSGSTSHGTEQAGDKIEIWSFDGLFGLSVVLVRMDLREFANQPENIENWAICATLNGIDPESYEMAHYFALDLIEFFIDRCKIEEL